MCGQVSVYNNGEPYPYKNLNYVTLMRTKMQGFIVTDHMDRWGEARQDLARWIEEGKLKTTDTVVKGGLLVAEQSLLDLFKGSNKGKLMLEVKSVEESPLEV